MLPKKAWKNHGVSEVVGTILILLMTVVLFSTVIIWVNGFPAPKASNRLDMEARVVPQYVAGVWNGAQIILTHRGGEDLRPEMTRIYRTVNRNTEVLQLSGKNFDGFGINSYGISGPDTLWNIGETWTYVNHSIPQNAQISIIIADIIRSSVLWEQDIYGVAGLEPPLFVEKWTDSSPATPSRDPIQPGDTFDLYAHLMDPDGDLDSSSVTATFTFQAGSPVYKMWDDGPGGGHGDNVAGDGVFTLQIGTQAPQSWDGGIIVLDAKDTMAHDTKSRFILSVVDLGTTNVFNNNTGSTGPLNLTKFNDLQRYDLFNKTEWDSKGWSATPTRTFKQGETVVVVIASQYLKDIQLSNVFTVYDTTSGTQQILVYGGGSPSPTTHPSSNSAFTPAGSVLNYNVYTYTFSTKASDYGFGGGQMAPGRYPFSFDLKSAFATPPKNRFSANDEFTVTDSSGNAPNYPAIATYADLAHTVPQTTFNFYSTLYIKITVKDTDSSFTIGAVEVQDYIGGIQVLATPGTSPVSAAQINGTTAYKLSVDLSKPNRSPWIYGNNTYTLSVQGIKDLGPPTAEEYNSLATQIKILGPRWSLDAIIGTLAQEHQNFGDTIYGRFYANTLAWGFTDLEAFPSAPGSGAPSNPVTALAYGDLDGDSDLDIAAGQDSDQGANKVTGVVEWYENTNGVGYPLAGGNPWVKHTIDTLCTALTSSPCITAVTVGHIDRDARLDIAVGTTTGDIWWYSNDGQWTAHFIANVGAKVNALKAADLSGDKIADLVVAANTGTSSGRVYINDGTGVFGTTSQTINPPTNCCLMASDVANPIGTLVNTYSATQSSNDVREEVTEARANYSVPSGELPGALESDINTYTAVQNLDGIMETLTEGMSGTLFSLGSAGNGHRYNFTNEWVGTTDRVEVHVHAGITSGSEAFNVRWSTSATGPWTSIGTINSRTFGEYVFPFTPTTAINGATMYISLYDADQSASDGATDGVLTTLDVDQVYLLVSRATGTTSASSKMWTTQAITAGQDTYKFFVEGFHTSNNEGDDFVFRYSTTATGPFLDLLTMKTISSDSTVSVSMDKSIGGKVLYILVEDTDGTTGHTIQDTVKIDYMYINGYKAAPVVYNLATGTYTGNSIAVGDIDTSGRADIAMGMSGAANRVLVFWNNGNGQTYSGPDVLATPAAVNSVDIGYLSGSPNAASADGRLDVAASLTNNRIVMAAYGGAHGAWAGSLIWDLSTTEGLKIRVGDVDGDYWDDVIVMTSNNYVFYIHNKRGTGFEQFTIDNVASAIKDLDIGDADRGIMAIYCTI